MYVIHSGKVYTLCGVNINIIGKVLRKGNTHPPSRSNVHCHARYHKYVHAFPGIVIA